ncbi:MAG: phosphatase PAP2 family protein [Actinomycetota bacterium]
MRSAIGVGAAGYLVLASILVGIGLSLTHGLLQGPLGRWDESVNDWFLAQRTPILNDWSHAGSFIAMTGTVVAIAAVVVIGLALRRRWRDAGFLVLALTIEVSVFLTTTFVVNRSRPTVPRLEPSPPTSSFPSGHTAAAVALYVGLALLLSPHLRPALKVLLWIVAVAIPVGVALARVYAGMHHVTDVIAGGLLGLGALVVATYAAGKRAEQPDDGERELAAIGTGRSAESVAPGAAS